MSAGERRGRVGAVIGAVARQALEDWGARRVALLDDGSPEAELASALLLEALGADAVVRVRAEEGDLESLLLLSGAVLPDLARAEAARLRARLLPDALPAHPANKTALLLGGPLPPEPLLPLGDLYAAEVEELAGGWSAPAAVRELAELCGGIARLDDALRRRMDRRDPGGLDALPPEARQRAADALARGAASRLWPRVVPKIGHRTLGADLLQ